LLALLAYSLYKLYINYVCKNFAVCQKSKIELRKGDMNNNELGLPTINRIVAQYRPMRTSKALSMYVQKVSDMSTDTFSL